MSIQQNINQTLSLASYIGSQIVRTKQEKITLEKATKAEEQKVRLEQAKQKYEEAEISYLQLEGVKKGKADWQAKMARAKREGSTDPEFYNAETGKYKTQPEEYTFGPTHEKDLYKRGITLSGAAETYYQMGGSIPTEKMARYRNLGTAEPPATTKKTKPEIKAEEAQAELAGSQKVENDRLTGGNV